MLNKFLFLVIIIISFSCNKSTDSKACWNIRDYSGNLIMSVCNKTEAEVRDYIRSLPGSPSISDSDIVCLYNKVETDKYCWMINNQCVKNATTSEATYIAHCRFGTTPIKVTCDSCCTNWYNRYSYRGHSWMPVTYSAITINKYCGSGLDTVYQRKRDTLLFTQDSLVTRQYSSDGVNW